jgi:hypothetical protein
VFQGLGGSSREDEYNDEDDKDKDKESLDERRSSSETMEPS